METIILWNELTAAIGFFYLKPEGAGCKPIGIECMLRIHFIQHCFNLFNPAVEEVMYDSRTQRQFVGDDLGRKPVPKETVVCKYRHFMEKRSLADQLFHLVNQKTLLRQQ